jgi:hypothetical protein
VNPVTESRPGLIVIVAISVFLANGLRAEVVIDDGGDHLLAGDVTGPVYVRNQSTLTVNADNVDGSIFADDSTIEFLSGDFGPFWREAFVLSNGSVLNSSAGTALYYSIVDSEANFFAGLGIDGAYGIDADGNSIVRLIEGGVWNAATGARIRFRGNSQLLVSPSVVINDVVIIGEGSSQGSVVDTTISSLILRGSSSFNISHSTIVEAEQDDNWGEGYLRMYDDARFQMTDGTLQQSQQSWPAVITDQRSQAVFHNVTSHFGAEFWYGGSFFLAKGESSVQLKSGEYELRGRNDAFSTNAFAAVEDNASVAVDGGTYRISGEAGYAGDRKVQFDIFEISGTSKLAVSGGTFESRTYTPEEMPSWSPRILFARGNSNAVISGGNFEVALVPRPPNNVRDYLICHLEAIDASTITLIGSGFNYPLGPITDVEGTITGFLKDGSPIDWNFRRDSAANIVLVPEPSAIALCGLGWLLAIGGRRCSHKGANDV